MLGVRKSMLPVKYVGVRKDMLPVKYVGVSKGMLPVKYFCSNKATFLCQSNFMEIVRLS